MAGNRSDLSSMKRASRCPSDSASGSATSALAALVTKTRASQSFTMYSASGAVSRELIAV